MTAPGNQPSSSALGPSFGPTELRDAIQDTLHRWLPAYLAELRRSLPQPVRDAMASGELLPLADFVDWVNQPPDTVANPNEAPQYMISMPGTAGTPYRKGNGRHQVRYVAQVTLWLWGGDYQEAEERLGRYLRAVRQCLLQNGSLGGVAKRCAWRSEAYQEVGKPTAYRTWGRAALQLEFTVDDVVDAYAGPPPVDPDELPTIDNVTGHQVVVGALVVGHAGDPPPAPDPVPVVAPPFPSGPHTGDDGVSRWWYGQGPPPDVIVGAQPGDHYLDQDAGTYYTLT